MGRPLLDLCHGQFWPFAKETIMFRSWIERYRQRRLQRQTISMLHSLDDHRLADVGTVRDSIELFVAARLGPEARKDSSP
jgi:uncharacterized protein YjiS (DUF1127 family)